MRTLDRYESGTFDRSLLAARDRDKLHSLNCAARESKCAISVTRTRNGIDTEGIGVTIKFPRRICTGKY